MARPLQLAPALIVAALSRFGGPRGQVARRRRRGLEALRAAGGAQARNIPLKARSVTGRQLRRTRVILSGVPEIVGQPGPARRAPRP